MNLFGMFVVIILVTFAYYRIVIQGVRRNFDGTNWNK